MWGGAQQGWNQWALQPAMFNDVPHEQIDWAALAKQWIQMQQAQPASDPSAPPVIPPIPPPAATSAQPNIPPPPGHVPILPEEFSEPPVSTPLLKTPIAPGTMPEPFQSEMPFETEPSAFLPKPVNNSYWNKSQWESTTAGDIDERLWPGPPIEPAPSIIGGKETYDYGHMHDNPPLAMQSIDYNHMSDFSYNQVYPSENQYDQYWSQVNAAPPVTPIFLKKERTNVPSTSLPVEEDTSQIDAAKRKQLPAWIREGLEKMEQERLKKIEKERAEKEKAAKLAQSKLKSSLKEDTSTLIPVKSKFESDSDAEDEEVDSDTRIRNDPVVTERSPSPLEDLRTEEEKRQEFILNVRRILTEVLLTVTDAEMRAIAEEVIKKEKLKARQLASTASLTSVASGLRGLANYGTESEASEAEDDKEDSDSEEELHRRIREKKRLFALKRKKIAELEQKELEEQNEALKAQNENTKTVYNESTESETAVQESDKQQVSTIEDMPIPFLAPVAEISEQADVEVSLISDANLDSPPEFTEKNNKNTNHPIKKLSNSPDSSENDSESSEKQKKRSEKNEHDKVSDSYKKNKNKSPVRKHRRSRSSDSDSSGRHHKRSYDKSSKKSSSYKKKKKYKRSDSSSSSSRESSTRRYSSKLESSHNHRSERRSRSFEDRDRKRKRSVSPKSYRSSTGSHRSRDSYSYRHEKDKYDKQDKYYYKKSPSPHRRSSKLPKKYRSSRSPSSEIESSGKKLKKYRNH